MSRFISLLLSAVMLLTPALSDTDSEDYEKMTSFKESVKVLFSKKDVISVYHNGEESTDVFDENSEFSFDNTITLEKKSGEDFKILTLCDVHFSDYGYRVFNSVFNVAEIKNLVRQINPDLIILPGDIVCGSGENSTFYSVQRITDLMESFEIPWAPVFGNHDDEANCDLNFLADIMMKSPHCLMKKGDSRMGVGNYIIRIAQKNSDGTENTSECIFMMDSHHSQPNEMQQKWFRWASDGINRLTDGRAEISLFMHIPLPEYQYAYEEAWNSDTKKWNSGYGAYGSLHEEVCCERDGDGNPVQRGFFDILKDSGTAKYVFCAHDHRNDYSVEYNGIRLTYLMKLGLSSGFQLGFNGGSVITVGSDGINRINHKISVVGILFSAVDINTGKQ